MPHFNYHADNNLYQGITLALYFCKQSHTFMKNNEFERGIPVQMTLRRACHTHALIIKTITSTGRHCTPSPVRELACTSLLK